MAAILFVRIKSRLDPREVDRRLRERRPQFLEVPGLVQKLYGRERGTDDVCGVYFFETRTALDVFGSSELARSIATAYEADDIRREVYDVLYPLRPEIGPFSQSDPTAAKWLGPQHRADIKRVTRR
jgi:hypothetical protein